MSNVVNDLDYLYSMRDVLTANLKAVRKLKPHRRPPGVESRLVDLLNDTGVLIVATRSSLNDSDV